MSEATIDLSAYLERLFGSGIISANYSLDLRLNSCQDHETVIAFFNIVFVYQLDRISSGCIVVENRQPYRYRYLIWEISVYIR